MVNYSFLDSAKLFIEKYYPHANVVFLAGSNARGDATNQSDIDLLIIDNNEKHTTKFCKKEFGWKIEAFIYNEYSFNTFFETDCMLANPFLPRMCSEGIILVDDGSAKIIQEEATIVLKDGPIQWDESQLNQARYLITDQVDDLIGATDEYEMLFIVNRLSTLLHEFILRVNRKWTGEGKWLVRSLLQFNEKECEKFCDVFSTFYKTNDKNIVINYVKESLKPYGGLLFDGFKQ